LAERSITARIERPLLSRFQPRHAREDSDDKHRTKHTLAWIDERGTATIDYRPVHDYIMTNDVRYMLPKAGVY